MKRCISLLALSIGMAFGATNPAFASSDNDSARQHDEDERDRDSSRRYTPFANLKGREGFKAAGVRYTFGVLPTGGIGVSLIELEPYRSGVDVRYNARTGDVTYETPAGQSVTFTAADEVPGASTPQQRLFNKVGGDGVVTGGSLTTPIVNAVELRYTRFGTLYSTPTATTAFDGHAFVFGDATQKSDLPKRGTATYTSAVGGSVYMANQPAPMDLLGSTASFSANFRTGAVNTSLTLIGRPLAGGASIALDNVTGVGAINRAKPGFSGSLTGSGSVAGDFSGAFFGPNAVEFGYDFVLGGTSAAGRSFSVIGGVAGSTAIAPPPPPPPPPPYPLFTDLTGVQTLASTGVRYTVGGVPSGGFGFALTGVEALGVGVAVQYDTATGNITFTAPSGSSALFTAADEVVGQSTPAQRIYNKANPAGGVLGGSFTAPSVSGVPLSYTRFGTFFASGPTTGFEGHAFVFGVQTRADDVPTTGTASYTGVAGGSAIMAAGGASVPIIGTSSLVADFGSASIATALNLFLAPVGGAQTPLDTLAGTGTIGTILPGFVGSLAGSGSVAGTFAGAFFGPQAAEFGYDFLIGGINGAGLGFTAVGGAAGRKP